MVDAQSTDELTIKTPMGPIVARGTTVFLVLALAAMGLFDYLEMNKRSTEHLKIESIVHLEFESFKDEIREEIVGLKRDIGVTPPWTTEPFS